MKLIETTAILKDAIEQSFKGPHHLEDLVVDEVSLVTEPAILSDAESKAHAGFTVVKSGNKEPEVPEAILKSLGLREGEDLGTAVQRLAAVCKVQLMALTGDTETFYMSPLKIYADKVVMGFMWGDDALSLCNEGKVGYYACYYGQGDKGDFTITQVCKVVMSMAETPMMENLKPSHQPETPPELAHPALMVAPPVEGKPVTDTKPQPAAPDAPGNDIPSDTPHLVKDLGVDASLTAASVRVLYTLQALERNDHSAHLQAKGATSYSDHLLFERLYKSVQDEIDGMSEKMVAAFGPEVVDAAARAADVVRLLQGWETSSPDAPLTRALAAELELQAALTEVLKQSDVPQGWQNFLQGVSDSHETALYLLKQRLQPGVVMKSDGTPDGVVEPEVAAPAEVAPEVPVVEETPVQKSVPEAPASIESVLRSLVDAGKPFRLEFDATGRPSIVSGPAPVAEAAPVQRQAEGESEVLRLRKEADSLRVQLARPLGDVPESTIIKNVTGGHDHPHDPLLAAAMSQTRAL